jgi:hypothetical protein
MSVDPVLADEEAWKQFNQLARALKDGISGEELIRYLSAGEFDKVADPLGHRYILRLALMIPVAEQAR